MSKFSIKETIVTNARTVRLGTAATELGRLKDADVGKFVKLAAESRYVLAAVTDPIEGFITSIETATVDGYSIGGIASDVGTYKEITFDGLSTAPGGSGIATIGAYVVTGTPAAAGTPLTAPPRVCYLTAAPSVPFAWRVVSLGSAGTGAAGTTGVIERVS